MKNGFSGVIAFWYRIHAVALSVMSVRKWYFGSPDSSTGVTPSKMYGAHWFVSPPMKP